MINDKETKAVKEEKQTEKQTEKQPENESAIKKALKKSQEPSLPEGTKEFQMALSRRDWDEALTLLKTHSINLHANIGPYSASPLHLAATSGNIELVDILIENGLSLDTPMLPAGDTPRSMIMRGRLQTPKHFAVFMKYVAGKK